MRSIVLDLLGVPVPAGWRSVGRVAEQGGRGSLALAVAPDGALHRMGASTWSGEPYVPAEPTSVAEAIETVRLISGLPRRCSSREAKGESAAGAILRSDAPVAPFPSRSKDRRGTRLPTC
jgi:hypothetical protein